MDTGANLQNTMPNYRRAYIPGGTWFFTVNLLQRHSNNLLVREIEILRTTLKRVLTDYPFRIDAWEVLPEHIHCMWTLPPGDDDFSTRWRLIKSGFSRALPKTEYRTNVRQAAETRLCAACAACAGLALFHVPSICQRRYLSARLVRRCGYFGGWR